MAKVLKVNEERIFLSKIRNYKIVSDQILYQAKKDAKSTSVEVVSLLFALTGQGCIDQSDKGWDNYSFNLLRIEMYNGNVYYFYDDVQAKNYIEIASNIYDEARKRSSYDANKLAKKIYPQIRSFRDKGYSYTDKSIEEIVKRLDDSFDLI